MAIDFSAVAKAIETGALEVERLAAWVENAATLADATKLGVAVFRAFARHGKDPVFGSKELADAAIMAAEVKADVLEDAAFPPVAPSIKDPK